VTCEITYDLTQLPKILNACKRDEDKRGTESKISKFIYLNIYITEFIALVVVWEV
jgi:hypothetical protein